jgi:DnaK suppressor protein
MSRISTVEDQPCVISTEVRSLADPEFETERARPGTHVPPCRHQGARSRRSTIDLASTNGETMEDGMEADRAKELLRAERARTQQALDNTRSRSAEDRSAANEPGDMFDSADPLIDQGLDDSVVTALQKHLEAIERAERRVDAGTYGRSVRSGAVIPDERLEADPAAELTVDEAVDDGTEAL